MASLTSTDLVNQAPPVGSHAPIVDAHSLTKYREPNYGFDISSDDSILTAINAHSFST